MQRLILIVLTLCLLGSGLFAPNHAFAYKYQKQAVSDEGGYGYETTPQDSSRFVQLAVILTTYLEGSFGSLLVLLFGSGTVVAFAVGRFTFGVNGVIALVGTLTLRFVGRDLIAEGALSGTFILFLAVLGAGFAASGFFALKDKDSDSKKRRPRRQEE